jgi:hypothetical protein
METRNSAPLLVTLFAALAALYPVASVFRAPASEIEPQTNTLRDMPESQEGEPANREFPGAKDLVAQFLYSQEEKAADASAHPTGATYDIDFLVATVPDPASSRLPNFFDSFTESIESAAEAAGYTLDRFALPWVEKDAGGHESTPRWRKTLYDSIPGLILFRNPHEQKLLLVFLVGETPTTGIHKRAMFSALDQMAQFYPWDARHTDLPPGFPQTKSLGPLDTFRVMGPAFSGSAVSLRFVLDRWLGSRSNISNLRFQIISGTATAIDASWLSHAGHGQASFQATVPPDDETFRAVACYIQRLGYDRIAILTEANTAYGQNLTHEFTAGGKGSGQPQVVCRDTPSIPDILSLPFPLHISRLRTASRKATLQQEKAGSKTGSGTSASESAPHGNATEPREVLPAFSDLSVQSAELTLSNLLSTIARERYSYVGIVATDVRDVTFLARQVREHCPATVLFTINSDLLYAYPDVNDITRGMVVITPYPLFNLEQLWTYPYRGGETRLQFSSQAAEGVYNATLALLHQGGKMVDYGIPLPTPRNSPQPGVHKPSLWVTAIGNGKTLPVSLLRWEDHNNYTFSLASPGETQESRVEDAGKPNVGRGIYGENSVVAVITLSLLLSTFSVLIVSQYQRSGKKKGADRISALLGDTVSPAYWAEGRLFLLCCCASLLTIYVVVIADFCLPLIAGRELGSSVQTTLTPKIALFISIVTILLLLLATYTLAAAFHAAPSDLSGSAPEVVLFVLLGCVFVLILAGLLVISWIEAVKKYPASGLFSFLRSFDLRGGLSPLLPLSCVATAGCLWAFCSFRRLRLIDILRASGTVEKPHSWLSFLSIEVRSFGAVQELENNIKHNLESSSVISLKWYASLLAVALLVGHYFFDTRLVRALEARPFYWIFEAAFFIVYWALLMEFSRLVFAYRSLHLLLQRLSWHPLLGAFKRYRECFPSLSKMNLTHPPSGFAALETSVDQAGRLLGTAKNLIQAADTDPNLRELFRQSISEWEAPVRVAEAQLREALRLQWTDASQINARSQPDPVRKKRAGRIKGDWRQSLESRCRAQHALLRLLQMLSRLIEKYWVPDQPGEPPLHTTPEVKEFFDQAEEFIVGRIVNFLAVVFPSLQNLGYFVLAGLLLMLLAVTSYPFQPRNEFLFFNWVVILSFIGTVFWIFIQMDRDTVLSLLNGTNPGQVNFSRELALRTILYIAVPLLALLGAQFPESLQQILSLFTAAQVSP